MKRQWKSLLLSLNWLLLSVGTTILIILIQFTSPVPAQTPHPSTTANKSTETSPTPAEITRQTQLIAADQLYLAGKIPEAEKLYRQVKEPFPTTEISPELKPAFSDPSKLSPGGKVYWRESAEGIEKNLETQILIPLKLLVEEYPEFIPGHIRYAQLLKQYHRPEVAFKVIEQAATLYPHQPDLIKAKVIALAESQKWMEASLAARQFAILHPQDPQAPAFIKLADDNLNRYKSHIRAKVRTNTIANVITGAVGYAVTGSIFGPFTALDSTILLLRGEGSIGESVAKQAKKHMELILDEPTLAYVNQIGQKLVKISGRNEFKYEFFVIPDRELNAFALPGGKIFINAGAIAKTNSEAELAGLIGHELSHVVLSHGFQLITEGNFISNITQYLPFGGTVGQLFTLSYSRDMERQADMLGTRLAVGAGYAADGLRNLMVTLDQEKKFSPPAWLASHPGGKNRVKYLEALISQNRYNRYAYEGIKHHQEIKARVKDLLKRKKEREHKKPISINKMHQN
jgi:predicted Zn-dependent protease